MALTRCAALDVAPHGIRVNAVSPSLAMHPFLAKVTSDELLAELKQREAFGRAAEPWEVANVMVFLASDYSSYLTGEVDLREQPTCLRRPTSATAADRDPTRPSCSHRGDAVRGARASRTPPCATSPTRRASCPAASTTTSTPRRRWSTSCSTPSRRSCSRRTTRIEASDRTPAEKLEAVVRVSFDAIDQHHSEVAIFQTDAAYLAGVRSVRLPLRAQRALPRPLDRAAARRRRAPASCAPTSTSSSSTASSATPSGSRSRWYRPGGRPDARPGRRPVPAPSCSKGSTPMSLRPTSSTPSALRSASAAARSRQMHSADLGAHVLKALVERTGVDPGAVDDVVMGCCDTIGSQAGDVARTAWLVAGLPDHVPGVTIDRQCGSSQQAVHFAAQGVMSGTQDLVVAGGLQNMSAIPISAAMLVAPAVRLHHAVRGVARLAGAVRRPGGLAVPVRRDDRREVGHQPRGDGGVRTRLAHPGTHRDRRGPVQERDRSRWANFDTDECPRETSLEKMAGLKPLAEGGRITAAVASQICDASSAMLIASEQAVADHGLTPRARIHHLSVRGDDPVWMLTGPIRATRHALEKTGLTVDDIDLFECNEAFASVVLAWSRELDVPLDEGQRQRRRHRARPPDRRHRHAHHGDAAQRARTHRRPLRPADDVRGRRPGQRHDHRAPRLSDGGARATWVWERPDPRGPDVAGSRASSVGTVFLGVRPDVAEPRPSDVGAHGRRALRACTA